VTAIVSAFLGFGLLGLVAQAVVVMALGAVCGWVYWTYGLVRFALRMTRQAVVTVLGLVLFTVMEFVHVGPDFAGATLHRACTRLPFPHATFNAHGKRLIARGFGKAMADPATAVAA